MIVLLVGSGAREHALAWALTRSGRVDRLYSLPGNPGMAELGDRILDVDPLDVGAVAAVARVFSVDLVVVGPEAPLARGLVDALGRLGIPAFGPTRAGARLEASKTFAKEVMRQAGVPTAEWWSFEDRREAERHVRTHPGPYVVKADGLAAGKGVLVTEDREAALSWLARCFEGGFGDAGSRVVLEERLDGPELSVFAVCAGEAWVTLAPARDYKRLGDGDTGPNTGGMGSYSPVDLPAGLVGQVEAEVIGPTLAAMAADGSPYTGFLYAGLVLTGDGPRVIEFNCRLGDPEAQVVLPRLETDLLSVMEAAVEGRLPAEGLSWSEQAAVDVVLAADGYPDSPRTGDAIRGLDRLQGREDVLVFHAGTAGERKGLRTAGGRVLNIVGLGDDLAGAREAAYAAVDQVHFPRMRFRRDVAGEAALGG